MNAFIYQSVFSDSLRTVAPSASALLEAISSVAPENADDVTDWNQEIQGWQLYQIRTAFEKFEAVILGELQAMALYHVSRKGGFDTQCLTDKGHTLFPASLLDKAPEAMPDAITGAKCMAFELWTAMGFHFHRANEAVLRRYYASVIGSAKQPKHLTMGTMLSSMDQNGLGHANIIAALKNITVFHRNPIAHPDHHIVTGDEALSLYSAIRAAMGYMLDLLPSAAAPTASTP